MPLKSPVLVAGLLAVLAITGYFALRPAHSSPLVAVKQAEGPAEPPEIPAISGLARSRDGHTLATVNDHKSVALWDAATGKSLRVLESGANEWVYSPAFSPDGSLLATPSSTPYSERSGHLLLWDSATGQRLASVDDLSWPVCCASFNPAGTLIVAADRTLYLVDPSTRQVIRQAEMEHVVKARSKPSRPIQTETCWLPPSAMAKSNCGKCRI